MEKNTKGIHRGRVLHQTAEAYPGSIKDMVKRTGYKYGTFFKHILVEELSFSILAKYGRAMNKDFSLEFPEMANLSFYELPKVNTTEPSNEQLKTENYELRGKVSNLLERINQMMEENYSLKEVVRAYKAKYGDI